MYCRCNGPDVPIATPTGPRRISELRVGDLVYSVENDAIVVAPLAAVVTRPAPADGYVRVVLDDGSSFVTSAVHPLADGRIAGALAHATPARRPSEVTYDILPATESGTYFVGDVAFASTLRDLAGRRP